ncbi:MAG: DNA mismatch repair protein MutS [Gemmatimonadota bacterium]
MATREETPLMRQWREVKARHPDSLLFFRVGDFFELFYKDAEEGSRLLNLTLTARNNGAAAAVPMAGVPAKALDDYLARLVRLGRRAAICDQVEDPTETKGIVRREVTETVTPGTVLLDALLRAGRNNYLVAVTPPRAGRVGIAAADLSTGELTLEEVEVEGLAAELGRIGPAELLLPRAFEEAPLRGLGGGEEGGGLVRTFRDDWIFDEGLGEDELLRRFGTISLDGLGFEPSDGLLIGAAGAVVQYAREIQPGGTGQLQRPRIRRPGSEMALDEMTRRNLELVEPLRGGEEGGTLLAVLDDTVTPMGARLLRQWILRPLVSAEAIWARQDAVEELVRGRELRDEMRRALAKVQDLERLAGKVGSGRVTPRELRALGRSLALLPELRAAASGVESSLLGEVTTGLDPMDDLVARLGHALADDPPHSIREGGVIRTGFSAELDELRGVRDGARDFIASLQARERERTGIGSLRIGFNRVFGYYLEITKANLDRVPGDYVRKQTLANAERYFTPELKEWEEKVSGAEERILELETRLFQELRGELAHEVSRLQEGAGRLARLDLMTTFAQVAQARRYVRPELHTGFELELAGSRHPVVETMMPKGDFIPNDLILDESGSIVILTGPNMAGKSTILRQVGLIQLLGQIGSFVPADRARLPLVDRIFTRVGASDNLARGHSTFMVEMHESAAILHGATSRSLILLDEIGRGTSTYDGVSIAWAVTEHLHEWVRAKTIFATHYHELTQLGDLLEGVKNMNVAVREAGDEVVFLRRLEEGGADRSYGIQVARLAGLPAPIIARAKEILAELEGTHSAGGEGLGRGGAHRPGSTVPPGQLSLFTAEDATIRKLRELEPENMTPLEALNVLSRIVGELRRRDPSHSIRNEESEPR